MSNKNTNQFVPKLRFPDFRDAGAWGTRELGEFITERNQFPTGSVSLFSLTIEDGITPKTKRYERSFLVNDEVGAYKLVLPDDFAYNPMNLRFGAIGRHSGIENVAVSKYYNIFFCDKTVDSKFCEIYFKSDQMIALYDNMAIGSLIEKRRVYFSDFLKFNIRFPLLPEQQKIADCLSSLDELITTQAQKIDTLKVHKKGLMQKLFPAEGETVPGLRFPEFRGAGEWEVKNLGEKANKIGSGITPKGGDKNYRKAGRPFVRSQNVGWGCLILDNVVYIDEDTHSLFSGTEIKEDDVLLNISGASIGRSAVADKTIDGGNVNQHVCIIRTKSKNLNPFFLNQFLLSQRGQCQIDSFQAGGNRQGLNFGQIRSFSVSLPPKIDEQQKIADCLSSLDALITAEVQKIDTLKAHKKGLMQGLFPSTDEVGV